MMMKVFRYLPIVLLSIGCHAFAADPFLNQLQSSLEGMRGKAPPFGDARGATPQLTAAKHQLRDWVESHLRDLPERGDEGAFERTLNLQLREAKVICSFDREAAQPPCPDGYVLGFAGDLTLRRSSGFLVLKTALGIECGFDESAYVYSWSGEAWQRVWQSEQNTYTKEDYKPQTLSSVLISPSNRSNDYLVLTLGSETWCSSSWHRAYYRAFRLGPDQQAGPLVEGAKRAYLGADGPPIQGSVSSDDVLVEYTVGSIDGGVHNREAVNHYKIEHSQGRRVDPFALSPRDFVDEWLNTDWREASHWSESADRASTGGWHKKLHKDFVSGEFLYPTMHCESTPDLWQVGIDFSDAPTGIGDPDKGTYFLVRWRPPYRFTMVKVSDHPSLACTEKDSAAADERRTLFPIQQWR